MAVALCSPYARGNSHSSRDYGAKRERSNHVTLGMPHTGHCSAFR
jgi:hypothetical protein